MVEVLSNNLLNIDLYTKLEVQQVLEKLRVCLPIEVTFKGLGNVDIHEINESGWVTYASVDTGNLSRTRTSVLAENLVSSNNELMDYVLNISA